MSNIKIDVKQEVTSRLSFEPYAAYDNFCLGYLTNVSLQESESAPDAKWDYAGFTVPRLVFEFTQQVDQINTRERVHIHSILPISNVLADGTPRKDADIETSYLAMWGRIKHIFDQYSSSPNFRAITDDISFDFNASPADRIQAFKTFFTLINGYFNKGTDEKPIYLPYGGDKKDKLLAIKLVATGQTNNRLDFPTFVGKGFLDASAKFANGKLDTYLKFKPNETPIVGNANVRQQAAPNISSELPADVQELLKNT